MAKEYFKRENLLKVTISFDDFIRKIYEDDPSQYGSKDDYDYTAVNLKVKKAILFLLGNKPFYGRLIPHLNVYGATTPKYKTMCTDGTSIIFHPEFVERQNDEALRFVLAHELLHCIGEHHQRRGNRDPTLWNVACDYSINPLLDGESRFSWPVDEKGERMGLLDPQYEGWKAEDIYDDLYEKQGGKATEEQKRKATEGGLVTDEDEELPEPDEDGIVQISREEESQESGKSEEQKGKGQGGQESEDQEENGEKGDKSPEGEGKKPGDESSEDKTKKGDSEKQLPRVGQKVRLKDGRETTIKRVFPNGDIEI